MNFFELGPQNSRGFRALKVWLALRQVGRDGYRRMIADDMLLSQHLHERVAQHHFSYIGDAEVGRDTNVGAGTITCNYDGVHKHRTEIGANVFIGSDTLLVAPVKLGDDSATGSGSVVTHDVPPGKLAYGVPAKVRRDRVAEAPDAGPPGGAPE